MSARSLGLFALKDFSLQDIGFQNPSDIFGLDPDIWRQATYFAAENIQKRIGEEERSKRESAQGLPLGMVFAQMCF